MVFVAYLSKRNPCSHNVEGVYPAVVFNLSCHLISPTQTAVILNYVKSLMRAMFFISISLFM